MINYIELLHLAIDAALQAGESTLKYYNGQIEVTYKIDNSPLTLADLESDRIISKHLTVTGIPVLSEETASVEFSVRKDWELLWIVDPLDGTKEFINHRDEYTINIALIEKGTPVLGVVYSPVIREMYFALNFLGSFKIKLQSITTAKEIVQNAHKIEALGTTENLRIIASKSHMSEETKIFIQKLNEKKSISEIASYGSSLKFCRIAEGKFDIYPRLGPTMEWDTAAGNAVAEYAGCLMLDIQRREKTVYNKENLLNPDFVLCHMSLIDLVKSVID